MSETLGVLASAMITSQQLFPSVWADIPNETPLAFQEVAHVKIVAEAFSSALRGPSLIKENFADLVQKINTNGTAALKKRDLSPLTQIARILGAIPADEYLEASHIVARRMVDGGFLFLNREALTAQILDITNNLSSPRKPLDEEDRKAARALIETKEKGKTPEEFAAIHWWIGAVEEGLTSQNMIEQAQKNGEKAQKLGILLARFPDIFTSKDLFDLFGVVKSQFSVANGLGEFILARPETFRREHIPVLIELANTYTALALGLAYLSFRRWELFETNDVLPLLTIAKKSEISLVSAWMLSAIRYPKLIRRLMERRDQRALGAGWAVYLLARRRNGIFQRAQMLTLNTIGHRNVIVYHAINLLRKTRPELFKI